MNLYPQRYRRFQRSFGQYWRAYGGIKEVLSSPYLHVSFLCTILALGLWSKPGWWSIPLGILPSLLGFTLGGYAILMSFGNQRFQEMIRGSGPDGTQSPFIGISATFAHFVVMQIFALLTVVILSTRPLSSLAIIFPIIDQVLLPGSAMRVVFVTIAWGLSFMIFMYSIILSLAATLAIFRLSAWYDQMPPQNDQT